MEKKDKTKSGMVEVFTKYITRNGKRIYHPTSVFHFWVPAKDDSSKKASA